MPEFEHQNRAVHRDTHHTSTILHIMCAQHTIEGIFFNAMDHAVIDFVFWWIVVSGFHLVYLAINGKKKKNQDGQSKHPVVLNGSKWSNDSL